VQNLQNLTLNVPEILSKNCKKNESQLWRLLAAKRGNLAVSAQRHVIAPFISFLLLYGGFIQGVLNKRVMDDFLEKCTKISLKFGISAFEEGGQSKGS